MTRLKTLPEHHLVARVGWLRAAVLGANDGIGSSSAMRASLSGVEKPASDTSIT